MTGVHEVRVVYRIFVVPGVIVTLRMYRVIGGPRIHGVVGGP